MKPLDYVALVVLLIGFVVVFAAKPIAKKLGLAQKQKCQYADQMTEEEVESYKLSRAVVSVKMIGLVITIPGLIMFILSYK